MKTGTLVAIIQDGTVVLGKKKVRFAAGTYNGPGGKMEPEDGGSLTACACRETREEWEVELDETDLVLQARVLFHFADVPAFNVFIFRASRFSGELHETDETECPRPFAFGDVPLHEMLAADASFFPKLLAGERFSANAYYLDQEGKHFVRTEFLNPDF